MTAVNEFFEHINFGGRRESFTTPTEWRWQWIKFGSGFNDIVSSLRTNVVTGLPVNVYAFKHIDFTDNFVSLNIQSGASSWWSAIGAMNDQISSALIFRRSSREFVQPLKDLLLPDFRAQFDAQTAGTQVRRQGEPIIYAVYVSAHDPNSMLVRVQQSMLVELECWSDYDARVMFDLKFTLGGSPLDAFCAWVTTWVESGPFSGQVFDRLHPRMVAAGGAFTQRLRQRIAPINDQLRAAGIQISELYVLPGSPPAFPPPNSNFGRFGSSFEDCCLVLVRR